MATASNMTAVLDEAMRALASLDLNRLEELEAQTAAMQDGDRLAHEKKQLMTMLLLNCRANLDALHRVLSRNTGATWVH